MKSISTYLMETVESGNICDVNGAIPASIAVGALGFLEIYGGALGCIGIGIAIGCKLRSMPWINQQI